MFVVQSYLNPPGCCFRCLGNSLPAIDLLQDDDALEPFVTFPPDQQGSLYLCIDCVGTMAGMLGFISPEGAQALNDRSNIVIERAEAAEAQAREQAAIIDGLERALARHSTEQEAITT